MGSLANQLAKKGWLSLNELVKYLKQDHPEHYISYPTALSMVKEGKIRVITVGSTYRIYLEEITRFIREGNYDPHKLKGVAPEIIQEAKAVQTQQARPQLKLVATAPLPEED